LTVALLRFWLKAIGSEGFRISSPAPGGFDYWNKSSPPLFLLAAQHSSEAFARSESPTAADARRHQVLPWPAASYVFACSSDSVT